MQRKSDLLFIRDIFLFGNLWLLIIYCKYLWTLTGVRHYFSCASRNFQHVIANLRNSNFSFLFFVILNTSWGDESSCIFKILCALTGVTCCFMHIQLSFLFFFLFNWAQKLFYIEATVSTYTSKTFFAFLYVHQVISLFLLLNTKNYFQKCSY